MRMIAFFFTQIGRVSQPKMLHDPSLAIDDTPLVFLALFSNLSHLLVFFLSFPTPSHRHFTQVCTGRAAARRDRLNRHIVGRAG